MEDVVFDDVTPQPEEGRTVKDILKEEGRTQTWLIKKLGEYGINRDKAQVSQYCTGKYRPKDEYILRAIAEILGREFSEINNCF